MPQKSGDKGRWENSARKERRAAQFGEPRDSGRRDFNRDNQQSEGRKSFHSDRKFNGDRRDFGSNKGRDFHSNRDSRGNREQNNRNEKRNNSPVQFSSFRRGK